MSMMHKLQFLNMRTNFHSFKGCNCNPLWLKAEPKGKRTSRIVGFALLADDTTPILL